MKKRFSAILATSLILTTIAVADPEYNADGELLLPENYDTWVFVGTNLGLGYIDEPAVQPEAFHNVYMEPDAYASFMETGDFALLTQFLFEVRTAESREESGEVNAGVFNGTLKAVEMSVKDANRPTREGSVEEWAYYNFSMKDGVLNTSAKAFPDATCWQCHEDHAGYDHVWVQLYPRLKARLEQ